jgi:hypothetical protein
MTSALREPECATCDQYVQTIEIHGPEQLRRIVGTVQTAVAEQKLRAIEGQAELVDLPGFSNLDLSETLPDVLAYRIECTACGRAFELSCECYHGVGGHWRPV